MRRKWLAFLFFAVLSATACSSAVSTNPNDYVGEYVFTPYNSDTAQFADFVILKKDFTAVEIRFSKDSGQVLTTEKRWSVYSSNTKDKELVIGDFGHPIEGSGVKIKLHNNYDLGTYYEKIR
jgi:hypothetical protein